MKKGLGVILCGCLALTLTGCGKEEAETKKGESKKVPVISCSASEEDVTMTMEFTYNESKTEVTGGTMIFEADFKGMEDLFEDGLTEENIKEESEELCQDYEELSNSCKVDVKGTKATVKIDINLDKYAEVSKEDDYPFTKTMSMEDVEKAMKSDTEMNVVCKQETR